MILSAGLRPRSTVEEGRDAVLGLLRDPSAWTGRFYDGQRISTAHAQAYGDQSRARLWQLSESFV